jgi:hypothetical protein
MPQATAIQNTKKQAPPARRPTSVKPHRDLTPTQDEVADLPSDLIMNGGSEQDLNLFLRALLRHAINTLVLVYFLWPVFR